MLFTHSASFSSPPPPEALTSATAGTSPPSSRSSRLRRFGHLRSYNPGHLLSRDSSASPAGEGMTRSASDLGGSVPRSTHRHRVDSSRSSNRLTLINSAPGHHPLAPAHNSTNDTTTTPAAATAAANSSRPAPPSTSGTARVQSTIIEDPSQTSDSESIHTPDRVDSPSDQHPEQQAPTQALSESQPQPPQEQAPAMARARASTTGGAVSGTTATTATTTADFLPSIRFSAYYDPRSSRPSLTFPPISRTLPTGSETIRVGRYSERDSQSMSSMPNNHPSAAAVGFKSKVVSRRHCQFWYENGKWFIKDVKSSSGTFLNHIRLSPPSQESKAFPVNDGDIVQLGIDFKGGEEMIFRCVKMRIELNRGWQNKLNTFNMAAHKRLRTMAAPSDSSSGAPSQDCSICLNSIGPCQSLFVAPCSHTWHFKCVRSLLTSPQYPIFICPNCRAGADLEADVDDPAEDWEQLEAEGENGDKTSVNGAPLAPAQTASSPEVANTVEDHDADAMDVTVNTSDSENPTGRGNLTHATTEPLPITNPASGSGRASTRDRRTPSPPTSGADGPMTPRNEAGPWVFDGRAGRRVPADPDATIRSLDATADMAVNGESSDDSIH